MSRRRQGFTGKRSTGNEVPTSVRRAGFWATLPETASMVLDVALFFLAVQLAYYLRFLGRPPEWNYWGFRNITSFMLLIPMVVGYVFELYRVRWSRVPAEEYFRLVKAAGVATLSLMVVNYAFRGEKANYSDLVTGIPTLVVLFSFFTYAVLLCGWRLVLASVSNRLAGPGLPRRVLVVGGPSPGEEELFERLCAGAWPALRPVGYLGERGRGPEGLACLGEVDDLLAVLDRVRVEEVLIAGQVLRYSQVLQIIQRCEQRGVPYLVIPSLVHMLTSRAHVELINYVPVVHFGSPTIEGWDAVLKRLFDVGAAAVLLVAAAPVIAAAMLATWVESGEPPLFVQTRVGRGGRRFRMFKLRTMWSDMADGPAITAANDARITRVGRLLRVTSVDELPQLVNVLAGDMSLVGPRAVVPEVADRFNDVERMTLNVLPGITGLAQVSGRDELGFLDKSLLNIYYIKNHSILLDLVILLRTVGVVLTREGTRGTRDDRGVASPSERLPAQEQPEPLRKAG